MDLWIFVALVFTGAGVWYLVYTARAINRLLFDIACAVHPRYRQLDTQND